jgi:ABC-type phosphate transport system substrate-binding protein
MHKFKFTLLAATVIAGAAANPAFAQQTLPTGTPGAYAIIAPGLPVSSQTVGGSSVNYDGDFALHAAGATSIQNVLVRVMNCLGTPYKQGNGQPGAAGSAVVGSLSAKTPGTYAGSPAMTCNNESSQVSFTGGTSAYEIQPQVADTNGANWGFAGKYVGTGSGFGRKAWYWFGDVFDSGSSSHAVAGVANPFNSVSGDNRWSRVQFAVSDAPIAQSDLNLYNTAGNAVSFAGPAIQFPLFVLPVAITYDSEYGINAANHPMTFNAQFQGNFSGTSVASLRMTAQVYCSIFNGDITNWNDAQIKKLNKNVALFDPSNDTLARWTKDGAPIRLAGRMDNSGTTDVFTRHLAQVCSQSSIYTPVNNSANVNKYLNHAESLPYSAAANGNIDYTPLRSDVNYKPSSPASKFAGTTNTVSGDYFNGTAIVNLNPGVTISAAPAGAVGSGLYIVTNGGGNLAKLLSLPADYTLNGVKLNGKIGYISADFVQPSIDAPGGLVAASLTINGSTFVVPTILNALKAFNTAGGTLAFNPPQSDSTGAYVAGTADTRVVSLPGSGTGNATRANPIAWTDVLYQSGNTLAQPAAGYPITGTTQFFGYTCYATAGNRQAVAELLGTLLGEVRKDASGSAINAMTFNATSAVAAGILDQSNIGIMPKAWQVAINNTFLSSTADAGSLGLWIQSGLLPTFTKAKPATKTAPAVPASTNYPTANTTACSGMTGA